MVLCQLPEGTNQDQQSCSMLVFPDIRQVEENLDSLLNEVLLKVQRTFLATCRVHVRVDGRLMADLNGKINFQNIPVIIRLSSRKVKPHRLFLIQSLGPWAIGVPMNSENPHLRSSHEARSQGGFHKHTVDGGNPAPVKVGS